MRVSRHIALKRLRARRKERERKPELSDVDRRLRAQEEEQRRRIAISQRVEIVHGD